MLVLLCQVVKQCQEVKELCHYLNGLTADTLCTITMSQCHLDPLPYTDIDREPRPLTQLAEDGHT